MAFSHTSSQAQTVFWYFQGLKCIICTPLKIDTYQDQNVQLYDILKLVDNMLIDYVQIPVAGMVDVANQTDLSSYDAAYLWLSLELSVPLVTLDKDLNSAAHRFGIKTFDMFE